VPGPALEGDGRRLLERVLGAVEVAEGARQERDRPPVSVPERPGDGVVRDGVVGVAAQRISQIGRTSTAPCVAPGIRRAASIAWSRVSHSTS
jgi:hypothetical protein